VPPPLEWKKNLNISLTITDQEPSAEGSLPRCHRPGGPAAPRCCVDD
jgi:hypothetical protein